MALFFEQFRNVRSGKVVTVSRHGILRQYDRDDTWKTQQWVRLQHSNPSDGTFKLTCRASGLVADAMGGQLVDHALLQHYPFHGNPNQRWRFQSTQSDSEVFSIHAHDSDKVWDIPYGSHDNGAVVQLYTFHGGDNQLWRRRTAEAYDDVFVIEAYLGNNLVLDLPGYATTWGGGVQQYPENGGFNQMFRLRDRGTSGTEIISISSGNLLIYPPWPAMNNTASMLAQQPDNGGRNQRWDIAGAGQTGGHDVARIESMVNSFRFTAPSPGVSGTWIYAGPPTSQNNQKWVLKQV